MCCLLTVTRCVRIGVVRLLILSLIIFISLVTSQAMSKYVKTEGVSLTAEVRNLLSVAYKNVVGTRRSSWRVLSSLEQLKADSAGAKVELIQTYKKEVEDELEKICKEVIVSLYDLASKM